MERAHWLFDGIMPLREEGFDPYLSIWDPLAMWMFGLAQMFSTVSPAMFEEYEINYMMPLFERFGLVYYGCCDPRAHKERGAEQIGKDYVFSNKPNPAFVSLFDEETIRKDLEETGAICDKYGCPLEFIFKDISTVGHEPLRLKKWADMPGLYEYVKNSPILYIYTIILWYFE
jgi:hypothetical protein